jgi:hypothetical protein
MDHDVLARGIAESAAHARLHENDYYPPAVPPGVRHKPAPDKSRDMSNEERFRRLERLFLDLRERIWKLEEAKR